VTVSLPSVVDSRIVQNARGFSLPEETMFDEIDAAPRRTSFPPIELPYRYGPRLENVVTVSRKELLRYLTEASLLNQLILVRGPAGSGKTTLLAQWLEQSRNVNRSVAWLTVDRTDTDTASLLTGLADALDHAGCKATAEGFRTVLSDIGAAPISHIARRLAAVSNVAQERPIVILDRFELIDGPAAGEMISGMLHHATSLRLIIASRVRLAIPLGALRARDQYVEIGPSDLNLTPVETYAAFNSAVPEIYARRLHIETSGEAVAVGFARRVLDESPDDTVDYGSWRDQLYEYYRTEVLDSLPSDLRAMMSRLVVVERFDVSLAQAVVGREALDLIERLYHVEGLLLRHRGSREFYFSEMLRRFLESRLAWLDEKERADLHRRAAHWFLERGRVAEALRHAVEAGARDLALNLLERIGYANVVAHIGVPAAHSLLNSIEADAKMLSSSALLSLALVYAHKGDIEAAVVGLSEVKRRLAVDNGATDRSVDTQLVLAEGFVAGFLDETGCNDNGPALERYLERISPSEHQGRAQAYTLLSWDRFCRGDIAAAERFTESAAVEYGETEGVYGSVFLHIHRTLAQFWRSDLDGALAESGLAERMTRMFFPEDQRLRALTGALRAGVQFEIGRPDPLTHSTNLVGAVGALESWMEMQLWAHRYGARAAMAAARPDEARAILAYGLEAADRLRTPRLAWNMNLIGIEVSTCGGDLDQAWHQARALLLPGGDFLRNCDARLTWQERIGGLLVLVRLLDERGDFAEAHRMLDASEREVAATSATRFQVAVQIARARLDHRQDRPEKARTHLHAARALCKRTLPIQLFLEGGQCLQPYLFELGAWSLPNTPATAALQTISAASADPLTARERQILLFMREGHPNKVAAHRLGLSEATVKFHLRNIYRKLRAQNRTQALAHYREFAGD
jgi:LuxR family transcriptional regulator, maltose regulon positive regulatory protein